MQGHCEEYIIVFAVSPTCNTEFIISTWVNNYFVCDLYFSS